jgi:hypothetical protein
MACRDVGIHAANVAPNQPVSGAFAACDRRETGEVHPPVSPGVIVGYVGG